MENPRKQRKLSLNKKIDIYYQNKYTKTPINRRRRD